MCHACRLENVVWMFVVGHLLLLDLNLPLRCKWYNDSWKNLVLKFKLVMWCKNTTLYSNTVDANLRIKTDLIYLVIYFHFRAHWSLAWCINSCHSIFQSVTILNVPLSVSLTTHLQIMTRLTVHLFPECNVTVAQMRWGPLILDKQLKAFPIKTPNTPTHTQRKRKRERMVT